MALEEKKIPVYVVIGLAPGTGPQRLPNTPKEPDCHGERDNLIWEDLDYALLPCNPYPIKKWATTINRNRIIPSSGLLDL